MVNSVMESSIPQVLQDIHFDQRLWINKIKFYKNQLDILQENLEKMVKFSCDPECMAEVEQYQNKFIVYKEVADHLIKDFKYVRNLIVEEYKEDDTEFEEKVKKGQKDLQSRTLDFVKFMSDLQDNFLVFYTSYHISDNHVYGKE